MTSVLKNIFHICLAFSPVLWIFLSLVYVYPYLSEAHKNVSVPQSSIVLLPSRLENPTYLIIPSIGVYASIQNVGLSESGEMKVPDNSDMVGWYDISRLLSRFGGAVVSGHLNDEKGNPGVFADLKKLKPGELIFIEDKNGQKYQFIIGGSHLYSPDGNNDVFMEKKDVVLNLVTCDGEWDVKSKTYSQRLVVSAVLAMGQ